MKLNCRPIATRPVRSRSGDSVGEQSLMACQRIVSPRSEMGAIWLRLAGRIRLRVLGTRVCVRSGGGVSVSVRIGIEFVGQLATFVQFY